MTFEYIIEVKPKIEKFLKRSCRYVSDKHISLKKSQKIVIVRRKTLKMLNVLLRQCWN